MGKIEELPDDFDSALDLNPAPTSTSTSAPPPPSSSAPTPSITTTPSVPFPALYQKQQQEHTHPSQNASRSTSTTTTTPAKPPAMASLHSSSVDEIIAEMNRTPLFMTSLDPSSEDNAELEALRALAYDGTPAEVAANFRAQGNEAYKERRWADAREFYTKGVAALKGQQQQQQQQEAEGNEERAGLEELLYSNRAAANLALQNYRQTTLDCIQVLQRNALNLKAHFRLVSAQLALSNLFNANTALDAALRLFPGDGGLLALQRKVGTRAEEVQRIEDARREREERKKLEARTLAAALKARGIRSRKVADRPPDMEDAVVHLEPDPVSPASVVHYPVLILYPLAGQSDLVKSFAETSSLEDHLAYIVEDLPWDEKGEYKVVDGCQCFMETVSGGMMKVGKKVSLGKVLAEGKVELVDGLLRVLVVPSKHVDKWVAEMKASRGK